MSQTAERILRTALRLFAAEGYEAASISRIAGELSLSKAAKYRHFASKQALLEAILARMEQRDAEQARAFELPEGTPESMREAYEHSELGSLIAFSRAQFIYWTQDEFAADFRRMLTLSQFRSEEMGRLYQQYLGAGPLGYVRDLLAAQGLDHPDRRALELYGPMFLLMSVSDGMQEKAEALRQLDAHLCRQLERLSTKEGEK